MEIDERKKLSRALRRRLVDLELSQRDVWREIERELYPDAPTYEVVSKIFRGDGVPEEKLLTTIARVLKTTKKELREET